jgi:hypothetical protein
LDAEGKPEAVVEFKTYAKNKPKMTLIKPQLECQRLCSGLKVKLVFRQQGSDNLDPLDIDPDIEAQNKIRGIVWENYCKMILPYHSTGKPVFLCNNAIQNLVVPRIEPDVMQED